MQHFIGKGPDFFWHGGAKEEVLPLCWKVLEDFANWDEEAHVKHVVGFIEDQGADPTELHESLTKEVEEPSWACNDDVWVFTKLRNLRSLPNAAINRDAFHLGRGRKDPNLICNLCSELAGGSEDECTGTPGGVRDDSLQNGDGEASGFTGTSLREPKDV